jgi:hypothetical protein
MNCQQCQDVLDNLLVAEPNAAERAALAEHLRICPDCARHYDEARQALAAITPTGPFPVSHELKEHIMAAISVDPAICEDGSTPPRPAVSKGRRIIVKSLLATAALLAACAALWWAIDGNRNSLYAQVIDAAHKARTIHIIHYELFGNEAKPVKTTETWYEKGVGFRREVCNLTREGNRCATICLGRGDDVWTLDKETKNTIVHSHRGIAIETDQIFADFDSSIQGFKGNVQRYPEGDQTFGDQSCKAYLPKTWSGTDILRELFFLDEQSRIVRAERQEQDDDRWKTTFLSTIAYDESFDSALFQPNFGKEFKIVDANAQSGTPEAEKPKGPVLVYKVEPKSKSADMTGSDMDRAVKSIDMRLNGGTEKLADVRKLNDRRIEVAMMRRNEADRQRVESQLTRPGTLEFRVLANKQVDEALIDRAENEPAKAEVLDPLGKRLAWWVPLRAVEEKSFAGHKDIAQRTKSIGNRQVMEILVVADAYNVTGAYLTRAKLQFDRLGNPAVSFTFNDAGGKLFGELTSEHLPNDSTGLLYKLGVIIDGELFSAPVIRSKIDGAGQITGSFNEIEASDIAAVLNAGSLPVQLQLMDENPNSD